jgi:hypothetical protein
MSAPERIWAGPTPDDPFNPAIDDWDFGTWSEDGFGAGASVQYVRVDLHDTLRAERDAALTKAAYWESEAWKTLRDRKDADAERDALAARVERLEGALETMQRSRDRYREEWERARGREEAAARAALSTDAQGPTAPATLGTQPDSP